MAQLKKPARTTLVQYLTPVHFALNGCRRLERGQVKNVLDFDLVRSGHRSIYVSIAWYIQKYHA